MIELMRFFKKINIIKYYYINFITYHLFFYNHNNYSEYDIRSNFLGSHLIWDMKKYIIK